MARKRTSRIIEGIRWVCIRPGHWQSSNFDCYCIFRGDPMQNWEVFERTGRKRTSLANFPPEPQNMNVLVGSGQTMLEAMWDAHSTVWGNAHAWEPTDEEGHPIDPV